MVASPFRVGITPGYWIEDPARFFEFIGIDPLVRTPGVKWEMLTDGRAELTPGQIEGCDAVLHQSTDVKVTARTLEGADTLSIIARFGVGYDSVDVAACTRNGTALTITPDGLRRPVATAAVTLLLALSHRLLLKDRLIRQGGWRETTPQLATGLTGKVLGVIGLGNIGRQLCELMAPFDLKRIAYDPYVNPETAMPGVELVDLDTLLRTADFVCICCLLTPETRHMLDGARLAKMKRTAYLVNVARGPIVDQTALINALREGRIRGAGLDVFEVEPLPATDPLRTMENVILTPHSLCVTDECQIGVGRSACKAILDVAAGRVPMFLVNREVARNTRFLRRLADYANRQ